MVKSYKLNLNKNYELDCATMDNEQVEEFTYNITSEIISNYFLEHQEEYLIWENKERIKQIVKECLKNQIEVNIDERIKLLEQIRKER